jgi:hypothetical protein
MDANLYSELKFIGFCIFLGVSILVALCFSMGFWMGFHKGKEKYSCSKNVFRG